MKKELAALELNSIVEELQFLKDGKIDQIFQPEKKKFYFQFYIPNKGKVILRITPKLIYLTSSRGESSEKPQGYCTYLRKYLSNARVREIKQRGFERIIEFLLEKKEGKYRLMIELFDKGNIILCDENYIVLSPLENQFWKDRTVKAKEKYLWPKKEFNFLEINEKQLQELLKKSKQESLVKTLAIDLGLGGQYSEELCFLAEMDKNMVPEKADSKKLSQAMERLKKQKIKPIVIYKNNNLENIVLFDLEKYEDSEKKYFETFNQALDFAFSQEVSKEKEKITVKKPKEIEKLENMIKIQEKNIEKLKKSQEENKRKAELIYENYQQVEEILTELKKAREKYGWKEIKEKLKGHKIIKQIDEKEGKVVIEL